jgi:hypothetical protein
VRVEPQSERDATLGVRFGVIEDGGAAPIAAGLERIKAEFFSADGARRRCLHLLAT